MVKSVPVWVQIVSKVDYMPSIVTLAGRPDRCLCLIMMDWQARKPRVQVEALFKLGLECLF